MLYRPDSKQLQSLTRIAGSYDGRTLIEILEAELQVTHLRLVDGAEDTVMRQLQGRGKLLKEMLDLLKVQQVKDAPLA